MSINHHEQNVLLGLYEGHVGKVSDKWFSYLSAYEALFRSYRDKPVRILEIGIQNGGSLEIWHKYFPKAEVIIGCDIDPLCANLTYDDDRIHVVVGDANSDAIQRQITAISDRFDIIIDDGSHVSTDIIRSFALYYPLVVPGGLFVAEDLHCSYWEPYEGGLHAPFSSISFFKRLSDMVNYEHWGSPVPAQSALTYFAKEYQSHFRAEDLLTIQSVSFMNSICAVHKDPAGLNKLGYRVISGQVADVSADPLSVKKQEIVAPDESLNPWGPNQRPNEYMISEFPAADEELHALKIEVQKLTGELARANEALGFGQELLNTARRKPFRMMRHYVMHKLLRVLAKGTPPLPSKMTARFKKSAAKRDPRKPIRDATGGGKLLEKISYKRWIETVEARKILSPEQQQELRDALGHGPTFSVVVPVYNPDPALLRECIQSVLDQVYDRLEVCIADDASTDPEVAKVLHECAAADPRIKLVMREVNGHICEASNSALALATGDYIALLDHDDLLPPHALLYMAKAIDETPSAMVLYSDEDKISLEGEREQPHFKPDFNRDLLYSVNYISHLGVYSRDLVISVGGFRKGFEGAQDYDLLLRCIAGISEDQIVHIPQVLYHWRMTENSTASSASTKNYAHDAGKKALEAHLQDTGRTGTEVIDGATPFTYKVVWPLPKDHPKVSLLIPTRDGRVLVQQAVDSILSLTTYPNYEIIIIDNQSSDPSTLAWFESICASDSRVRVLKYAQPFNYSAINNFGAENCDGHFIGLVNNDIEVISPEWLDEMVSIAARPEVGCVGAMLYYPNDTIQHAGVIMGVGGVAGHSHKNFPRSSGGYFGRLHHRQELTAVTAACMLVSRDIFEEVGGLDAENLTVAFNDVDFCLKVNAAGYHNVWTPFAELYHHESVSRGADDKDPEKIKRFQSEIAHMFKKWETTVFKDPHYNPNLTLSAEDFSLRE